YAQRAPVAAALSLPAALPIFGLVRAAPAQPSVLTQGRPVRPVTRADEPSVERARPPRRGARRRAPRRRRRPRVPPRLVVSFVARSEEHTSELQSRENFVCRLL